MGTQQFCLKWNNHHSNMLTVFEQLLSSEALVDVTLACEGLSLKAHKMVLSACSPFFQSLFLENPCKHPIVIMKDMRYTDLKSIIDFMYRGEVNVSHDQLSALLKTAETLKVKGLAEVTGENRQGSGIIQQEVVQQVVAPQILPASGPNQSQRAESPPSKRKRGRPRKRSLSDSNRSDTEDQVPSKIKEPESPEIEEVVSDATETSNDGRQRVSGPSSQAQSLHSTPIHNALTSHKSLSSMPSIISGQEVQVTEEPQSADEGEFEVEPSKLMEQTLTTDSIASNSHSQASILGSSSLHMPLSSNSSLDSQSRLLAQTSAVDTQALVPVSVSIPTELSSSLSHSQDSPEDIKPTLVSFEEPTISPVAGPSHDRSGSMMYMDSSGIPALPGPSNYQADNQIQPHEQPAPQEMDQDPDVTTSVAVVSTAATTSVATSINVVTDTTTTTLASISTTTNVTNTTSTVITDTETISTTSTTIVTATGSDTENTATSKSPTSLYSEASEISDTSSSSNTGTVSTTPTAPRFSCSDCNTTFANSGNLSRHRRYQHSHHGRFSCFVCEKSCKRADKLREHLKRVHNIMMC